MKRRILSAFAALALMLVFSTNMVFAGELELVDSYPKDGGKGMQIENAGVKLYFNKGMAGKESRAANANYFKFVDAKGKTIPTKAFYSPKERGVVLVLVDGVMLKSDSEYKLIVSKKIVATDGSKYAGDEDIVINFKTVNTQNAIRVNMIMMGVMMVAIVFMSAQSNRMKESKAHEEDILEEKVNPYKIAKEKGVPVEQVVEELERKKEKARKKLEKKQEKMAKIDYMEEDFSDYEESDNKKVSKRRSAAASGSKYVEKLRAKKK